MITKSENGHLPSNGDEKTIHHKKRRYRATDPDFVAPDGGWGWLIIIACGFSNLSNFPMFQQFGLIFRERFSNLGISNAQITTVINLNSAFNSCVGLLNGPLFRTFTYRQVALFGACLVATSLFITRFCSNFWAYLIFYAACYGSGIGITQSANSIALNTYWKKKRRIATGLSWSVTGLGPIVWPYIITYLMQLYGMENTLMLFAAFAGHAIVCSLLLQPVHWHTKFREDPTDDELEDEDEHSKKPTDGFMHFDGKLISADGKIFSNPKRISSEGKLMLLDKKSKSKSSSKYDVEAQKEPSMKSRSLFSSQYLYHEPGSRFHNALDIVEPGTPMLASANDGWYSQKNSLASSRVSLASSRGPKMSGPNSLAVSTRTSYANLNQDFKDKDLKREKKKKKTSHIPIQESVSEDCPTQKALHDLKEEEKRLLDKQNIDEKEVLYSAARKLEEYQTEIESNLENRKRKDIPVITLNTLTTPGNSPENEPETGNLIQKNSSGDEDKDNEKVKVEPQNKNLTIFQKIVVFFDLTLLKDPMYLNLMLGLTIANFAELNFSILTPFVLKEFNFEAYQIATFMSVLGALDIVVRLIIPFFAEKIGWENKTFFLIGVLMMAGGRVLLVHTRNYPVGILVAIIIGFGKGLRTIFLALVIPSYVPLERLPAASGLQLATSGLLFLILGPVVGWIRDLVQDYVITLHLLNITTYLTTIAWLVEPYVTKYYKRKKERQEQQKLDSQKLKP